MKSKKDIQDLMDRIFQDLQKTREAGQKEYAHDTENAFGNFERLAASLGISRERVLWVYVQKHLDGIISYLNGHKSQREDVRGRIKDVMVYLVLLWGMIEDDDNQVIPGKPWHMNEAPGLNNLDGVISNNRNLLLECGIGFDDFDKATQIINAAGYIAVRRKV